MKSRGRNYHLPHIEAGAFLFISTRFRRDRMFRGMLTMLGTRDFGSEFRRRYFPGSSSESLIFPRFRRPEFSPAEKRTRKDIESQSATRDSVVSPGDSAVPARSFALVREIMNGHTKREAEPGGRNTLIMSQRREYGKNKIRADVKPNRT